MLALFLSVFIKGRFFFLIILTQVFFEHAANIIQNAFKKMPQENVKFFFISL